MIILDLKNKGFYKEKDLFVSFPKENLNENLECVAFKMWEILIPCILLNNSIERSLWEKNILLPTLILKINDNSGC